MNSQNPTMKQRYFKTCLASALACLSMSTARAHYLWIEHEGSTATVFFGEYEESARERSPGRLDEIPGPQAQWLAASDAAAKPVKLSKHAEGFALASPVPAQATILVEELALGVKDWSMSGIGIVKPFFYARHQGTFPTSAAQPGLTLDIVPLPEAGHFKVYFRGKPLPKADVKIVAQNTWAQEGRTDKDGAVRLPLPWKGQYILQVIHLEQSAGEFEGKPFQTRRHRATLTLTAAQGEPTFSPSRSSNQP